MIPLVTCRLTAQTRKQIEAARRRWSEFAKAIPGLGMRPAGDGISFTATGCDEHQPDQAVGKLTASLEFHLKIGALEILYRETPSQRADVSYTHHRRPAAFARVDYRVEPTDLGGGIVYRNTVADLPTDFARAAEQGVRNALEDGPSGHPVTGLCIALMGAEHTERSTSPSFEIAARAALREALATAGTQLLEPIMQVSVTAPETFLGAVIGDLTARMARVQSQKSRGGGVQIDALAPLASMLGYSAVLGSLTQDRASVTQAFAHFEHLPEGDDDPGSGTFPPAIGMRA